MCCITVDYDLSSHSAVVSERIMKAKDLQQRMDPKAWSCPEVKQVGTKISKGFMLPQVSLCPTQLVDTSPLVILVCQPFLNFCQDLHPGSLKHHARTSSTVYALQLAGMSCQRAKKLTNLHIKLCVMCIH